MTTETMNVHKALCELKTLEERIEKAIRIHTFVFANKHANTKVSGVNIGEHCEEIKSVYQSINDLIARRDALKRAVSMSNATTKVTIAQKEYTVAEAIELKNHGIPLKEQLLSKLSADLQNARSKAEENNGTRLDERADAYIHSLYGNVDIKGASEEIKKVRDDFVASQAMEVVDPIGARKELERLESEINNFITEIDSALSVSNALTEITVTY